MLRLRSACVALACGLLVTLSGCASFSEDGRLFPRLFRTNYSGPGMFHGNGECECNSNSSPVPPIMDSAALPGPSWSAPRPSNMPIPITNIPVNQTPNLFKVPQAVPTPYSPTH